MAVTVKKKILKIQMIGPLPPPIGGVSVSFKILVDILREREDIDIEIIDFNGIRSQEGNNLSHLLQFCKMAVDKVRKTDVTTVYFATTALHTIGLLLLSITYILGKPFILRKAGGLDYIKLGAVKAQIAHFVVKHTDLYLAQTKELVGLAQDRGVTCVKWYPTHRPMLSDNELPFSKKICRRFVFVGQVRKHKGIYEIIQASERFAEGIVVDIYGPLFDDIEQSVFEECRRVNYCGTLPSEKVALTLMRYDMFLLPSKHIGEGYPGAILEAYSAGIPVITTRMGGIPEIVDEETGLFVEPGSTEDLFEAMRVVVEDNKAYARLRRGVYKKRKEFDATIWAEKFVEYCREVASAHAKAS